MRGGKDGVVLRWNSERLLAGSRRAISSPRNAGGQVATSRTRYAAQKNVLLFFERHPCFYYWTFTFAENLTDKDEAERRFKPFKDLVPRRRSVEGRAPELLYFWERQKRGAWHVHVLVDVFFDVNELRPWMVARGWGPVMNAQRIDGRQHWVDGIGWVRDNREQEKLMLYLMKYVTKSMTDSGAMSGVEKKKKVTGGNRRARRCNTLFRFAPWWNPCAKLWHYGIDLWRSGDCGYNRERRWRPTPRQFREVFRLGHEYLERPLYGDGFWNRVLGFW